MRKAKSIKYTIDENECFIVTSHSCNSDGYPRINRNNKNILISHLVYGKHFGSIPEGKCVIHTCKNRKCINLKHLKLKSKSNLNRKLTLKQILEIRKLNELANKSIYPSKCRKSLIKLFAPAYPQITLKTFYKIMISKTESI